MKSKYTIIHKFHKLTSTEMNLILYIMECQDQSTGRTEGLYYRDAIKHTGMCKQSFYNALRGLERKDVIRIDRNSDVDYDITVLGNGFPWKGTKENTYKEGYVNLAMEAFHTQKFKRLKAHEKYLLLEFLKRTHEGRGSYCIGVGNFYEKWSKTLNVTQRVVRSYLHSLRKFFSIGIKNGMYYITYLHSVFKKPDPLAPGYKKQEQYTFEQLVRKECNRLHISYSADALQEVAFYVIQHRPLIGKTQKMLDIVNSCIKKSVAGIRRSGRSLNKKYIHALVMQELELMRTGSKPADPGQEAVRGPCAVEERREEIAHPDPQDGNKSGRKNAFLNFHQRKYDYDELERVLLQSTQTDPDPA